MRKKRFIWAGIALLALATVWFAFLRPRDEPKYQGRYLSEWVQIYNVGRESEHAQRAQEAIGTNALPYFLRWMHYNQPGWKATLDQKLPGWIRYSPEVDRWLYAADYRAEDSLAGLYLLGTNAVSAIPELEAMMKDRTNASAARRAVRSFAFLGEQALPVLQRAFADPNQGDRGLIVVAIALIAREGHTIACSPTLVDALTDRDHSVRYRATNAIRENVPALLTNAPAQ